jgi:hypothetical protein
MPAFGYNKWGRDIPTKPNISEKDIELCQCKCCPKINFLRIAKGDLCDAVDVQLKHYATREHEINRIRVIEGRTPPTCFYCPGYGHEMTDSEWEKHYNTRKHKILVNRAAGKVLKCELCDCELADEEHQKVHQQSKRHLALLRPAFCCTACKYTTRNPTDWDRHRKTQKCPLAIDPAYKKVPKKKTNFHCSICDYYAPNNNKLRRHFQTSKHKLKSLEESEKLNIRNV